jgi:hypothetical protein
MRWGHPAHYYDVQHLINKFHLGIDLDFNRAFTAAMPDCDINIATWYHTAFPTWFSNKGSPFYLMQDFMNKWETRTSNAYSSRHCDCPCHLFPTQPFLKDWLLISSQRLRSN